MKYPSVSENLRQVTNPYLPSWEYVPDGEPYVFDERVYIFGSHDKYNTTSYCDTKYVGWSAPISDLSAWRYEGIIWDAEDDPDNASNMGLYAPDVTKGTDGKYYLYYPLNGSGSIGVARCDSPAGRYEYVGKVHYADGTKYGNKAGDPPACDPAIFVDEDGKVYLYSGYTTGRKEDYDSQIANNIGADGAYCIELESDMVTVKEGTRTRIVPGKYITGETGNEAYAGNAFFEAASMRKINGKYYFIYSNEEGHQLCYATGDSPYGPFTYGGIIVCNTDVGYKGNVERKAIYGNNHGSIAEINGEYYIFYHRQTGAVGRQACAEKIEIQADGSISQVCLTSFGLGGGRPMLASGKFPAYIACNISPSAAYAQDGADGDATAMQYVSGLENGEYAGYKYFYFNDDTNTISVTAKSPAGGTLNQGPSPGNTNVAPSVRTNFAISGSGSAIRFTITNTWTDKDGNSTGGTVAQGGKEIQVGYSFFELEAYGIKKAELPSNIALGKAVSTNLPAQYDALPVSAITDGSYADKAMGTVGSATLYDRYSSAPSPKEALVITINLGGTYDIGWAEFNSRYVISEGRLADAVKVEVGRSGISGTTWTTANENVTLNTGRDGEFVSTLIPFAETLTGNELRFTLSRHDYSNTTQYRADVQQKR